MFKFSKIAIVAIAALQISACSTMQNTSGSGIAREEKSMGWRQIVGTFVGAGAGAYAGSYIGKGSGNTIAMVLGGLIGAGVANYVGAQLDEADRQEKMQAQDRTITTGLSETWVSPSVDNRSRGRTYVARQGIRSYNGARCREVVSEYFDRNGQEYEEREVACQEPDGSWSIEPR